MNKTRMEKNKMSLCVRLCVGLTVASFGASALWAESAVYDLRFDTAYPRFLQRTEQTLWGGGGFLAGGRLSSGQDAWQLDRERTDPCRRRHL